MRRRALLATLPAAAAAGCTIGGRPPDSVSLSLSIPGFDDGVIPERYTCDGEGTSPRLRVDGVPEAVGSLAVVGEWLYGITPGTIWTLWNLPPEDSLTVPAGLPERDELDDPPGARQGTNDEGFVGYRPPCHETPEADEYRFELFGLESPLDLRASADSDAFEGAIEGNVLASASVIATYDRS